MTLATLKAWVPDAAKRNTLFGARLLTSAVRSLPSFLIIGTQRGGTTSLYNYLTGHPDVQASFKKEVHFFDVNFGLGEYWYRAHFPIRPARARTQSVTGEASPYYMIHPLTPRRVRELLPEVRLIALLRNPVDRAFSHYQHEVKMGREDLSFEEAIAAEPERIRGERERIVSDPSYRSLHYERHTYVTRGIYVDQIRQWRENFSPEQMLVLKSEEFYQDPGRTLRQVLTFVGLKLWEPPEYRKFNLGNYSQISKPVRARLNELFAPHNLDLYGYLSMDFGWEGE